MLLLFLGLGLPMSLIGFALAAFAHSDLKHGEAVANWPQTRGTITNFYFKGDDEKERKSNSYFAKIEYDYRVDERRFRGDRIAFGMKDSTKDPDERARLKKKYTSGRQVRVYYSPDDPEMSALEPGVLNKSILSGLRYISGGIGALGLMMFGYGLVGKKSSSA